MKEIFLYCWIPTSRHVSLHCCDEGDLVAAELLKHHCRVFYSKLWTWFAFIGWLMGAFLCGAVDHVRQSTLFLPVYFVTAAVVVVLATKKYRPPSYKFEVLDSGTVRSPLGFEVRVSNTRVVYFEGDHVVSWQSATVNGSVGKVIFSERGIVGWDAPFDREPMGSKKKQEVAKAVMSALVYLQLVEAGKIRPKERTLPN